ncbi:hypothetical protein Vadar_033234 [Vaccinium darrowii]|uniref:Uncharacterized protein n=1 Tax=Vaccinium darrowii TaxID=229202 RepID=A0ACB7X5V3_9ERIC|nr:hypothetical protein Vadar_033234 [Vaccinium darrowii]
MGGRWEGGKKRRRMAGELATMVATMSAAPRERAQLWEIMAKRGLCLLSGMLFLPSPSSVARSDLTIITPHLSLITVVVVVQDAFRT